MRIRCFQSTSLLVSLSLLSCTPPRTPPISQLEAHVQYFSVTCHPRDHKHPDNLKRAAKYVANQFRNTGLTVELQPFTVDNSDYLNVIGRIGSSDRPRVVVGAHYDAAEGIFADDVVSFGTRAEIVTGLDNLRNNQWEGVWPNIADFRVVPESIHGFGEDDIAWGVATWTSTGFDEDHQPFERPGRATVTLARRDGAWLATHTHFSLNPGTPPRTYGRA